MIFLTVVDAIYAKDDLKYPVLVIGIKGRDPYIPPLRPVNADEFVTAIQQIFYHNFDYAVVTSEGGESPRQADI